MATRKKDRADGLVVRRVPMGDLHVDPSNARKHSKRNLAAIRGSLKRFGQVEPLVVQKGTGRVIGGNGRLEVMIAEGATHADIVEVDADDAKAAALGIALNRTAELAEWDHDVLGVLAMTIDVDVLADIGLDQKEIDKLLNQTILSGNEGAPQLPPGLIYSVIVDFDSEAEQKQLLEDLENRRPPLTCRLMMS